MKNISFILALVLTVMAKADTAITAPDEAYVAITFSVGIQAQDEDYVELYCNGVYVCNGNNACWSDFTFYSPGSVFFEGYNFPSNQYASATVPIRSSPCAADIRPSVTSGRAPLAVSFDGTYSDTPPYPQDSHVHVVWAFGPSGSGSSGWIWNAPTGITGNYTYTNTGASAVNHQASLTLTGEFGASSTANTTITVYPSSFRTLTVQSGTSSAAPFNAQGAVVSITANSGPNNWAFLGWQLAAGGTGSFANANAGTTNFTIGTTDTTVYPAYQPVPPTNLASPSQTHTSVNLTWTASVVTHDLNGHDVYRTNNGITTLIGSTSASQFSFTDAHAVSGATYLYQVRIRASGGVPSPLSTALSVTVPAPIDADGDGVPDAFETLFGVQSNPNPSGSANLNLNVHRPQ